MTVVTPPASTARRPEADLPRVSLAGVGYGGEDVAVPVARYLPQQTGRASAASKANPLLVFLHEGLGCVDMWRGFPRDVSQALGVECVAFSRPGYGYATPRPPQEQWPVDFMWHQAKVVLPAFLRACGVDPSTRDVWLVGHSDGASIALCAAADADAPHTYAGVVAMSPHLFVEPITLASIHAARAAFDAGPLATRLAKFHPNPASAFDGWAGVWLRPEFASWNMSPDMAALAVPILAVQGLKDPYGTVAQVDALRQAALHASRFETLLIPEGGHDPHRDAPQQVIALMRDWVLV